MEGPIKVGQMLRAARLATGLTQQQVAEKVGMHSEHLSAYERDKLKIPEKRIAALVKVLPALKMEQLREGWAWASDPIIVDDFGAIRQLERLIAGRKGTIVALSGNEAGFPTSSMFGSWRKFLRKDQNRIVFIVPSGKAIVPFGVLDSFAAPTTRDENPSSYCVFGRHEDLGWITKILKELVGRTVGVKQRIYFYSPVFPSSKQQESSINARLQCLYRLLHPLTATILFEPEDKGIPHSGLIYTQTSLNRASKGEYIWMRPSSDFLGRLSSLLRVTLWANDRDKMMTNLSPQ